MIANATLYHIDWSDIQLSKEVVGSSGISFIVANAGEAEVDGFELEVDFRMTENLGVGFNYSYTDAVLAENYPEGGAFAGDQLPGSAKNTHSIFVDYIRPYSDQFDVTARFTHRYIDSRITALGSGGSVQAASEIPSYDTTDFRVGVSHSNGLEASLFVNNIFNHIGITWIENVPLHTRKRITQPRVIGLNIGYRF